MVLACSCPPRTCYYGPPMFPAWEEEGWALEIWQGEFCPTPQNLNLCKSFSGHSLFSSGTCWEISNSSLTVRVWWKFTPPDLIFKRDKVTTSVHLLLEIKPKSGSIKEYTIWNNDSLSIPKKIMCELQMYMF
jgi:hypothetical protein